MPHLKSAPIVKRHPDNPFLAAKDVPYEAALVFNAGETINQHKFPASFLWMRILTDKHG
jgi:beta-1,4-mannooligosaccharide/beta-1,4-mannosyl-N-acetylglucosamine phosphorylase